MSAAPAVLHADGDHYHGQVKWGALQQSCYHSNEPEFPSDPPGGMPAAAQPTATAARPAAAARGVGVDPAAAAVGYAEYGLPVGEEEWAAQRPVARATTQAKKQQQAAAAKVCAVPAAAKKWQFDGDFGSEDVEEDYDVVEDSEEEDIDDDDDYEVRTQYSCLYHPNA